VLRPLAWLLAYPSVHRDSAHLPEKPVLLIANHVSIYDVPLVLYALPGRLRRRVATAMAADLLEDMRKRRKQGNRLYDALGTISWLLITTLFNVFPLPRSAGFRRSFQFAGEALDHGLNVLVFPEGRLSEEGILQPFRSGIGLLVAESKTEVLPIAMAGMAAMKTGRERWFRSGKLKILVGRPISFEQSVSPEEITDRRHAEISRMLMT